MAEVPGLGHPAPVRGLPAQVSGGVNVREKFGESFVIGRSSLTPRSHTRGAGLASRRALTRRSGAPIGRDYSEGVSRQASIGLATTAVVGAARVHRSRSSRARAEGDASLYTRS